MIKGMDIFKDYFRDFNEQYVLIGGAACDIVMGQADIQFRATKDFDMVLVVEALTPAFGRRFWDFITDGSYENRCKSDGTPQFYRFDKPKTLGFPYMIELFSKSESVFDTEMHGCRTLHLGESLSSLSAILLNSDYYNLLLSGMEIVSDVTILPYTHLVVFKAKAWLNLTDGKASGQRIKSSDIRKHKNDVARLSVMLTGNESCELPASIRDDMAQFIDAFDKNPPDTNALGIVQTSGNEIAQLLHSVYLV